MERTVDVTVNEMMSEVVKCSEGKDVAVIVGYVSSVDDDVVRLHEELDPGSHIEVPKGEILYSTMTDCGKNKLVVNRGAKLKIVRRETIDAGDVIDGGGSDGVSEMIDLRKIGIKIGEALKVISHIGNCLSLRQRFDEIEGILAEENEVITDAQRKEAEQVLLRLSVDMQSCPLWIQPA